MEETQPDTPVAVIQMVFNIGEKEQLKLMDDFMPDGSADARINALLSYCVLVQHGIHPAQARTLVQDSQVEIKEDADSPKDGKRKRHPAWVVIDNKYIRYGFYEMSGSPLDYWVSIDPAGGDPDVKEIARPVILTIYNLEILRERLHMSL